MFPLCGKYGVWKEIYKIHSGLYNKESVDVIPCSTNRLWNGE